MSEQRQSPEPCFSVLLVRPFLTVLKEHPAIPSELIQPLANSDPDARFRVSILMELLRGAIELTGDEDCGLHAAEAATLGDYDLLEYAASTCTTGREAVEIVDRYLSLVDESTELSLEVRQDKAFIWIRSKVPLTRPAADFQMAAFFRAAKLRLDDDWPKEMEVWFKHPKPNDDSEYKRVFDNSTIVFSAPDNAFIFRAKLLDVKLNSSDPKLHTRYRRCEISSEQSYFEDFA